AMLQPDPADRPARGADSPLHSDDTRTVGRGDRPGAPVGAGASGAARGGYGDPTGTAATSAVRRPPVRGANGAAGRGPGQRPARGPGGGPGGGNAPRNPAIGRRGPGWWRNRPRWLRRLVLASIASFFLLIVALIGVVYAATKVPLPGQVNAAQTSVITYSNGSTELAKIGTVNRTDVGLQEVSKPAQDAVLAAEDRNFYHEPGISYRGIARALYTDVSGGGISQGGSTITQQYAKNAYLTQQRTFSRKIKEIVLAVKLDKKYSKDQILDYYLNTIYFGRGAYGIQAASKTYFGIDASHLTAAQGAVIAGLIRSPNYLDPRVSPAAAKQRWHEVLDTMVRQGWLPADQATASAVMPTTKPKVTASSSLNPQQIYIRTAVENELAAHGITEDQINRDGLRIVTTLDQKRQYNAYTAVTKVLQSAVAAKPQLQTGLVAIEPATGRILAWYGGGTYDQQHQSDNISVASMPPGSSFKPIVLAQALQSGISLRSYYNAPPTYTPSDSVGLPVRNDELNVNFGDVSLTQATYDSINTVYVPLAGQVGVSNVANLAHQLGIPSKIKFAPSQRIALGEDPVPAIDMANVYSTFANGGVATASHIVDKVIDHNGNVIYTGQSNAHRVLSAGADADLTYALSQVIDNPAGTAHTTATLANGRPAAGKTGTVEGFRSAWFCGYVPQMSSCVNMFMGDGGIKTALTGIPGTGVGVYGGGLPAQVWKAFMDAALSGIPPQPLPPPVYGGTVNPLNASPTPSPTPTPTPSPTRTPSATPTSKHHHGGTTTPSAGTGLFGTNTQEPTPTQTPRTGPSPQTDPIFGGNPIGGNSSGGNNTG
ncbi:MAG: transglycosylase domain-containing protein, partial [Frankia sp.]